MHRVPCPATAWTDNSPVFRLTGCNPAVRLRAIAYMRESERQQRVQADFFSHLQIPRIEPNEQSRIAAVLDAIDEAIAKTEAVIAKTRKCVRVCSTISSPAVSTKTASSAIPSLTPEQFQDSPLGRIPREWEVAPFRHFGTSDRPYLKSGPFGSSLKQQHWVAEGVPVVTIGSLGEGEFISSEILHVSKETARMLVAYSLLPGDIVFSRVADVGRSVVVTEAERGWIILPT